MDPIILEQLEETYKRPSSSATSLLTSALIMAVKVLSGKALVWVVTLAAGGLWLLAMLEPSVLKIVTASMFCLSVLIPILIRDAKGA